MNFDPENEMGPADATAGPISKETTLEHDTAAEDADQKEQKAPRSDLVSKLTDIPEISRYARRIGAEPRSLRKLVIEERVGKYRRAVAIVTFNDSGDVTAPDEHAPTADEAAAIKAAWSQYAWPTYRPCLFTGKRQPERDPRFPWSMADPANIAVCWDRERKHILCVEERRPCVDGRKDIWIWTEWTDSQWRVAEPPETLPLFGLDTIGPAGVVFVHEGPKAAKAIQALIADDGPNGWRSHPWGVELRGSVRGAVAHLGWMGGAERPEGTDWAPLIGAGMRVIVVADNDRAGLDAVSRISRATGMRMEALRFTDDWPRSADMADPIPEDRVRAGTRLSDLLVPATWATVRVETGGRPSFQVRREFIEDWRYTVSPPLFFHSSYPGRGLNESEVDAVTRPFSDAELTARLIRQRFSAQADGVAYLPGSKPLIERDGQRLVNMWKPSRVRERKGAAWPLGRLLTHLFPDRRDRRHVARWGATLAACPRIRMEYAVLLRSETQGMGKTTLANIAADLVGTENVSRPNEVALTEGNFNSHLAKKRLVIVDELYSGHSRKTYNKLKSPITDTKLRVNEKYQPEYEIDNFAHFIFSSNDLVPIFIEATDRRFFMPRMAEIKLSQHFWARFHTWLGDGGLGIAMRCSREFVEKHGSVLPGRAAPTSAAKLAMIENSVSDEMRSVREAARELFERGQGDGGQHVAITLDEFAAWHADLCRERGWRRLTGNRLNEELRKAGMTIRGQTPGGPDERVKIGERKRSVACNFEAGRGMEAGTAIREALKSMDDLGFGKPL